jgi:hypothetical protein
MTTQLFSPSNGLSNYPRYVITLLFIFLIREPAFYALPARRVRAMGLTCTAICDTGVHLPLSMRTTLCILFVA